MTKTENT